jgi:1,2-diacylglycerol 3-beta-glucosyltransferase
MTVDLSLVSVPVVVITNAFVLAYTILYISCLLPRHTEDPPEDGWAPLVSVIVPACNEEAVVGQIVRDLDAQSYENMEIVIVAHNCRDRTYEVATSVPTRHPLRVIRLETKESGKTLALGEGLRHAKGEVVAVFDADNRVPPYFVERGLRYLRGYDGVQGRILSKNPKKNRLTYLQTAELLLYSKAYQAGKFRAGYSCPLGGTGFMLRRGAIDRAGGLRNLLVEDLDLSIRLALRGLRVAYGWDIETYDEKVSSWRAFLRQRARWMAGYLQMWRAMPLGEALRLVRYPFDLICLLTPLIPVAILTGYLLTVSSLLGAKFLCTPAWWWGGSLVLMNSLATLTLRGEEMGWTERVLLPWAVMVYSLHMVPALFYAARVRSWGVSKTPHGS